MNLNLIYLNVKNRKNVQSAFPRLSFLNQNFIVTDKILLFDKKNAQTILSNYRKLYNIFSFKLSFLTV